MAAKTIVLGDYVEDGLVARGLVDAGEVLLLHNCSDHYLIVLARHNRDRACSFVQDELYRSVRSEAKVLETLPYEGIDIAAVHARALMAFALTVSRLGSPDGCEIGDTIGRW